MNSDLFDKYPEWVGMPEFVQEKKIGRAHV